MVPNHCGQCGTEISDENYCPECGAELEVHDEGGGVYYFALLTLVGVLLIVNNGGFLQTIGWGLFLIGGFVVGSVAIANFDYLDAERRYGGRQR